MTTGAGGAPDGLVGWMRSRWSGGKGVTGGGVGRDADALIGSNLPQPDFWIALGTRRVERDAAIKSHVSF